jgi:hypothetical protein
MEGKPFETITSNPKQSVVLKASSVQTSRVGNAQRSRDSHSHTQTQKLQDSFLSRIPASWLHCVFQLGSGREPVTAPFTHNSKLKKGKSKQSSAKFSWRQSHRKLIVRNQTDKSYLGSGTGRPKQRLLSWVSLAELPVKCTHTHSSLSSGRDKRGWVPPRRIGCLSLNRATYIRKAAAITHRRTYTRNYHRGPASAAKRKKVETCPLDGIHLTRVDATEDRPSVRAERK